MLSMCHEATTLRFWMLLSGHAFRTSSSIYPPRDVNKRSLSDN